MGRGVDGGEDGEIEVHVDEDGRRYSWNPRLQTAEWLDDDDEEEADDFAVEEKENENEDEYNYLYTAQEEPPDDRVSFEEK